MLLQVLKSKLKQVIVTDANVNYEGSLTLDPSLMEAAGIMPYERVEVNGVDKPHRLVTYVMPGHNGSGQVEMNGGMAQFFKPGDRIHVNCYSFIELPDIEDKEEISHYHDVFFKKQYPKIVVTDERNVIIEIK